MQNHVNKCKEAQRQSAAFMDFARGAKRVFSFDDEGLQRRRQPPGSTPQVWTPIAQ